MHSWCTSHARLGDAHVQGIRLRQGFVDEADGQRLTVPEGCAVVTGVPGSLPRRGVQDMLNMNDQCRVNHSQREGDK